MEINRMRWVLWAFFPLLLLSGTLDAATAGSTKTKSTAPESTGKVSSTKPAGSEKKIVEWNDHNLFEQSDEIPHLLEQQKISPEQIPNPHWREDSCHACHREIPKDNDPKLRGKNIIGLCNNCHDTISVNVYIHAVGMVPSEDKQNRMPAQFSEAIQRGGGVVTCITCHDLPMQCKKERFEEKETNPRFFRGGPYAERTDLCYNCHNATHYVRLNPHDQISDEGELNAQACMVCHSITPNRREVKNIDDVSFNVDDDLFKLCTGCHPWRPHPGGGWATFAKNSDKSGPNHLVKPTEAILKQLKKTESEIDITMPLDPSTGRVFCATCHNPHERGVQRHARADRGADGPKRLRREGGMAICTSCHNK